MTLNGSMNGKAFKVFVEHFLVPNLWDGAVVVMDISQPIVGVDWTLDSIGWCQCPESPYSPDFNPIELWSQLKAFLRQFSPTTTKMVDVLLLLHLIWLILSTSKTGLQAAVTVLHKPGICCIKDWGVKPGVLLREIRKHSLSRFNWQ